MRHLKANQIKLKVCYVEEPLTGLIEGLER